MMDLGVKMGILQPMVHLMADLHNLLGEAEMVILWVAVEALLGIMVLQVKMVVMAIMVVMATADVAVIPADMVDLVVDLAVLLAEILGVRVRRPRR